MEGELVEEGKDEKTQKQQLDEQVEELKCDLAALLRENDMFERFISRLDPQDLVSRADGESLGASQPAAGGRGQRWRFPSHISDRPQQLTLEQKLYVAQREVAETQQDHEKLKQRYRKIHDNYKASLQEAELRLEEVRKAKKEFERKMLKPLKDSRLEMKEPGKVTQMEKLNLKIQALKVQEKKLQQRFQQKREIRKVEYEAIFPEYNELRIDQSLQELQDNSLKVQRILSSHKEKLQNVTWESTELSKDLTKRKQLLAKIEEEIQKAEKERLKAEALNQHLRHQMSDYHAPDITEYMHIKDKHKKLQHSVHIWGRKVGIAEMALKTKAKSWSKQRVTLTPANSTVAGSTSEEHQIPVKLPPIAEHNT
ncbi:cilia- and flagella-associated protein 263 isoform X2 [Echeneis naucrates]|uniref:cilia- and flagella-associated protein 263 isoform X2 n=1 Tax=Echeneis naucrates TaxID=173247 RepID=UPI00111366B1|nr:coiled-coil domain-containing protein 113 isoform X2 [Echeneis naucrates]